MNNYFPEHGDALVDAIEIGDVFWTRRQRTECVVIGKEYQADLTVSYRVRYSRSGGSGRSALVEEKAFQQPGYRRFTRIKKVPRKMLTEPAV